jgi:microcystin-dependent protein
MGDTGSVVMWGTTTAPTGTLLCDGAAVSRTTYAALFALIGTTYGIGDGSTTFNLPDMRQKLPLGLTASGTGSTLAATGGTIDHVHDLAPGGAKMYPATTPNDFIYLTRKTLASWTETHVSDVNTNSASSPGGPTVGAGLIGDTDTGNPPFQALNFVVFT